MNYLIDTNIISEVRKGAKCNPNVAAWYESIDDGDIYLSVLVLGEIRKGVERVQPNDPVQARALENWLATVARLYAERILPIDQAVADEWGRMSARRPGSTVDALLAATAKVHKMTLATRNITDVVDLGAELVNPFERRS
ncbi:MAG: type II toxin-antitoxin system VapC family toxin [Pseudolabrys sp.]